MNNLEEFNKNLESLEKEVSNLTAIREAYQKVGQLSKEYEKIIGDLKGAVKNLDNAVSELKQQRTVIETATERQKTLIDNKFEAIKSKLSDEFKLLKGLLDEKAEKINDSNKKFYKEFVDTVQIRLDNHKGEIQRLIEHERSEIKAMFDKQTDSIEKKQNERVKELEEKIKQTKTIGLCFGIGIAILSIVNLILAIVH